MVGDVEDLVVVFKPSVMYDMMTYSCRRKLRLDAHTRHRGKGRNAATGTATAGDNRQRVVSASAERIMQQGNDFELEVYRQLRLDEEHVFVVDCNSNLGSAAWQDQDNIQFLPGVLADLLKNTAACEAMACGKVVCITQPCLDMESVADEIFVGAGSSTGSFEHVKMTRRAFPDVILVHQLSATDTRLGVTVADVKHSKAGKKPYHEMQIACYHLAVAKILQMDGSLKERYLLSASVEVWVPTRMGEAPFFRRVPFEVEPAIRAVKLKTAQLLGGLSMKLDATDWELAASCRHCEHLSVCKKTETSVWPSSVGIAPADGTSPMAMSTAMPLPKAGSVSYFVVLLNREDAKTDHPSDHVAAVCRLNGREDAVMCNDGKLAAFLAPPGDDQPPPSVFLWDNQQKQRLLGLTLRQPSQPGQCLSLQETLASAVVTEGSSFIHHLHSRVFTLSSIIEDHCNLPTRGLLQISEAIAMLPSSTSNRVREEDGTAFTCIDSCLLSSNLSPSELASTLSRVLALFLGSSQCISRTRDPGAIQRQLMKSPGLTISSSASGDAGGLVPLQKFLLKLTCMKASLDLAEKFRFNATPTVLKCETGVGDDAKARFSVLGSYPVASIDQASLSVGRAMTSLQSSSDDKFEWLLADPGGYTELATYDLVTGEPYRVWVPTRSQLPKSLRACAVASASGGETQAARGATVSLKFNSSRNKVIHGAEYLLGQRFINFTTNVVSECLQRENFRQNFIACAAVVADYAPDVGPLRVDERAAEGKLTMTDLLATLVAQRVNDSQRLAILHALNPSNALTVIWGPPGTGKTSTLTTLLYLLHRSSPSMVIAVTSFTKAAYTELMQRFKDKFPDVAVREEATSGGSKPKGARIVFGTVWQLVKLPKMLLPVDVLIIDEASQMPLADACVAASLLSSTGAKSRVVLAGDLLQFPPILPDRKALVDAVPEHLEHCAGSVMQAVLVGSADSTEGRLRDPLAISASGASWNNLCPLTVNYRSVEPIVRLVDHSYHCLHSGGTVSLDSKLTLLASSHSHHTNPLMLISNVQSADDEAQIVGSLVARYVSSRSLASSSQGGGKWVMVVTPHRRQRAACRRELENHLQNTNSGGDQSSIVTELSRQKVIVDTTERLQGQEALVVVMALAGVSAASDFPFNAFRVNVALSRAVQQVVVLCAGDSIPVPPAALESREARRGVELLLQFAKDAKHVDAKQLI